METLAETFANNKIFFLSGLFGVAYLVLATLMWKAYFPSARSVDHKNMMSIVHSLGFIIYHPAIQMAFTVEKRR